MGWLCALLAALGLHPARCAPPPPPPLSITLCDSPERTASVRGALLRGEQLDPNRTNQQAATELPTWDYCVTYTEVR